MPYGHAARTEYALRARYANVVCSYDFDKVELSQARYSNAIALSKTLQHHIVKFKL